NIDLLLGNPASISSTPTPHANPNSNGADDRQQRMKVSGDENLPSSQFFARRSGPEFLFLHKSKPRELCRETYLDVGCYPCRCGPVVPLMGLAGESPITFLRIQYRKRRRRLRVSRYSLPKLC